MAIIGVHFTAAIYHWKHMRLHLARTEAGRWGPVEWQSGRANVFPESPCQGQESDSATVGHTERCVHVH